MNTESDTESDAPLEHPCVDSAKWTGIKVRDFVYENHGVRPAPVVKDITILKAQYLRIRSSGHGEVPEETMEAIKFEDPEWFREYEERFTLQVVEVQKSSSSS